MPFYAKSSELAELLSRLCDGEIGPPDLERLETLLLDDPAAQDLYRRLRSSIRRPPPPCRQLSRLLPLFPPRLRRSIRLAASYSPMRRPW